MLIGPALEPIPPRLPVFTDEAMEVKLSVVNFVGGHNRPSSLSATGNNPEREQITTGNINDNLYE